jgi:hypothetical protein
VMSTLRASTVSAPSELAGALAVGLELGSAALAEMVGMQTAGRVALTECVEPAVLGHVAATASPDHVAGDVVERVPIAMMSVNRGRSTCANGLLILEDFPSPLVPGNHMDRGALARSWAGQVAGSTLSGRTPSDRRAAGAEMVCRPPIGSFESHRTGGHSAGAALFSLTGDRFPTSTPTCRALGGSFGQPLSTHLVVAATAPFRCQASGPQRSSTVDTESRCSSHKGMVPL